MTSNERKIINFLREMEGKTHMRLIAKKTNFSNDYTRSLCHSLARTGYIKLEDSNTCCLLKKGQGHFESVAVMRKVSKPVVVTANVALLTDESVSTLLASDRDDKTDDDTELDKALANLEPSSKKKDKPEEPKDETENGSRELEEEKTEEMDEESEEEINTDNNEVLAETEATEEEKMEKPDEEAEDEKPAVTEAMTRREKELTEEVKAENPERIALKKKPARSSGGFGASFKKVVPIARLSRILDKVGINWFVEKR